MFIPFVLYTLLFVFVFVFCCNKSSKLSILNSINYHFTAPQQSNRLGWLSDMMIFDKVKSIGKAAFLSVGSRHFQTHSSCWQNIAPRGCRQGSVAILTITCWLWVFVVWRIMLQWLNLLSLSMGETQASTVNWSKVFYICCAICVSCVCVLRKLLQNKWCRKKSMLHTDYL